MLLDELFFSLLLEICAQHYQSLYNNFFLLLIISFNLWLARSIFELETDDNCLVPDQSCIWDIPTLLSYRIICYVNLFPC